MAKIKKIGFEMKNSKIVKMHHFYIFFTLKIKSVANLKKHLKSVAILAVKMLLFL